MRTIPPLFTSVMRANERDAGPKRQSGKTVTTWNAATAPLKSHCYSDQMLKEFAVRSFM